MSDDDLVKIYDRLDFQAGQIHGLRAVCAALVHAAPSPEALRQTLQNTALVATARSEASTISDEYIHGLNEILQRFLAL